MFLSSMKQQISLALCGSLLVAAGCGQRSRVEAESERKPYFDLPALVQQQIHWLDSLNPPVTLSTRIGTRTETETMQKDSVAWAETLQLFRKADINRPVLQGAYEEIDSVVTGQGNRHVRTYRAKKTEQAEIPFLKVYYEDSLANVYRIETAFQEDNVLYSTNRTMWMTFSPYQGQPRVNAFETTGKQKMMLRDSVTYLARGELQYD